MKTRFTRAADIAVSCSGGCSPAGGRSTTGQLTGTHNRSAPRSASERGISGNSRS
jgi:hypothetical protein